MGWDIEITRDRECNPYTTSLPLDLLPRSQEIGYRLSEECQQLEELTQEAFNSSQTCFVCVVCVCVCVCVRVCVCVCVCTSHVSAIGVEWANNVYGCACHAMLGVVIRSCGMQGG